MEAEYDFSQGKRGAVESVGAGKTRITIRIDDDVLAWFKEQVHLAGGGNYQTLINETLKAHIQPFKLELLRSMCVRSTLDGQRLDGMDESV